MNTADTPPAEPLQYAVDITTADIAALKTFLHGQLTPLLVQLPLTDPVTRVVKALDLVVVRAGAEAERYQRLVATDPEQADPDWVENAITLRRAWYELVSIAEQWADQPGFDHARWHKPQHLDPSYAAAYHRTEADRRAALARSDEQAAR